MLIIEKVQQYVKPKKPKYGKVIALTAIAVAAVETVAVLALYAAKKAADAKIVPPSPYDEDFEITMSAGEMPVKFEAAPKEEDAE